eukprot:TRINITY_DN22844_c0_g1_i1.p1 TRINITY_DN22844_c0_g1~~TRINITY_DN22844_c0_g1_i1.p1  ORF type:complete len:524 (+),score=115.30 TRINITY_DN22844_c0_g1_i1:52-1623(+)
MTIVDPTTGLECIDIPDEFEAAYGALRNPVIHWIGHVKQFTNKWLESDSVMIISHSCIYMGQMSGGLTGGLLVSDIKQLIVDETHPTYVAIMVDTATVNDCDLVVDVLSADERKKIYFILDTIRKAKTGRPIEKSSLVQDRLLQDVLNLVKPAGYKQVTERFKSRAQMQRQDEAAAEMNNRRAQHLVVEEFERMKKELRYELASYGAEEFEEISKTVDMYIEMIDDRDREIDRLRNLRDTVYENPHVWDGCPNCLDRNRNNTGKVTTKTVNSLERQIADAEHLLDHLQHARQATSSGKRTAQFSESTQIIQLRQQKHEVNEKIQQLRNVIIESPGMYPSNEARRDALTRVGPVPKDASEREKQLARHAYDLDRTLAEKDKELRMTKSVMRESFQRQVEELERLKKGFESYDHEIVSYLEKIFSGRTYPPGATDRQTPRELAELTASAAKANATPVSIPESPSDPSILSEDSYHTHERSPFYAQSTLEDRSPRRAWLGANLQPLSERPSQFTKGPSVSSRKSIL